MATLKISDLSVGDWVGVRCGTKINAFKVEEIRFNNAIHKYVAILNNKVFGLPTTELHPIPITAEILEANGFVKNGEYDEWNIGTWRTPYLLGVSLEQPAVTIKWNCSSIFIAQAKNIHQLQHALRLAGVEKEIVMPNS